MLKSNFFLSIKKNLIFFLILIGFLFLGYSWERIQINRGMGWDGCFYTYVTMDFGNKFVSKSIDTYYIQKVVPPFLIWSTSELFHVQLDEQKTILGYILLNAFVILVALFYYLKIAKELKFDNKIKWIGFAAIFLTFPVIKFSTYYPALVDISAFCIGMMSVYYYLKNNFWGLIICAFIGAFTFPTLLYATAVLIIFPNKPLLYSEKKTKIDYTILFVMLALIWVFFRIFDSTKPVNDTNPINLPLFPITYAFLIIYLFIVFYRLLPNTTIVFDYLKENTQIKRIVAVAIVILAVRIIIHFFTVPSEAFNSDNFLTNIVYQAKTNPLIFLVAHTVYFGPLIILFVFFFKKFVLEVYNQGLGLVIYILVYMFIGLGSESRQFINAYGFFFILLLIVLNKYEIKNSLVIGFCVLSLIVSRFWYPMNFKHFEGPLTEFPFQHYFMFQGPWMNNQMYYLQGAGVILLAVIFYFSLKSLKPKADA